MPEPLSAEQRLAEIRERDDRALRRAEDPAFPLSQAEYDRTLVLDEMDRLKAELAALRFKAETRLRELATNGDAYRKVGNRAGAARQDYAAAEIRSLFGIEWKPGGGGST